MTHTRHVQNADALFAQGYNCAQAILTAFGPEHDISRERCLTMATPFGAGLGRTGGVCGAVTGALMVLGLRFGGDTLANPQAKTAAYAAAQEFIAQFSARNQTTICRELLGVDLSTPEGSAEAQARNLARTLCPKFVHDAAEILDAMCGDISAKSAV